MLLLLLLPFFFFFFVFFCCSEASVQLQRFAAFVLRIASQQRHHHPTTTQETAGGPERKQDVARPECKDGFECRCPCGFPFLAVLLLVVVLRVLLLDWFGFVDRSDRLMFLLDCFFFLLLSKDILDGHKRCDKLIVANQLETGRIVFQTTQQACQRCSHLCLSLCLPNHTSPSAAPKAKQAW